MNRLWDIFTTIGKILTEDDLKGFGKALFFGTSYKNLSREARRVIEALAIRIGATTNPEEVYYALGSQSWGYDNLKEIAKALEEKWIFKQLSGTNQLRILKAESMITWPGKPKKVEPFIDEINKVSKGTAGAFGILAFVAILLLLAG